MKILAFALLLTACAPAATTPSPRAECERPYLVRALEVQKRRDADTPALTEAKAAGKRMTDTPAYGHWLQADNELAIIRKEMKLSCH